MIVEFLGSLISIFLRVEYESKSVIAFNLFFTLIISFKNTYELVIMLDK